MVTPHDLPRNILYGNYHVVLHMYIYIHDKDINYNSWIFFVDDSLGFNANWISSQYLKTMYPLVFCYIAVENCHL